MTLDGDVVGLPVKLRHPSILFVFFFVHKNVLDCDSVTSKFSS